MSALRRDSSGGRYRSPSIARRPLIEDIPPYLVGACGLGLIHQRAYRLTQHIVDYQLHRTGTGQVVGDQGGAVEWVGKVGRQTTNFWHYLG